MNYGFPKSLWTGLGDVSANAIQMICATFVVYSLMKPNPQILDIFKWIGGLYFLVMFPTFLDPNNNFIIHFTILMTTHVFLDFFFLTIYAGISSRIAIFLKNYPNLISRLSGCVLLFLAYRILSTKINI
jgi:threonine/homoserine/homoserine lactone efflux protein